MRPIVDAMLHPIANKWHRLWSVRTALFWLGMDAVVGCLDLLAGTEIVSSHPIAFTAAHGFAVMSVGVARLLKQPGLHNGD